MSVRLYIHIFSLAFTARQKSSWACRTPHLLTCGLSDALLWNFFSAFPSFQGQASITSLLASSKCLACPPLVCSIQGNSHSNSSMYTKCGILISMPTRKSTDSRLLNNTHGNTTQTNSQESSISKLQHYRISSILHLCRRTSRVEGDRK